MGPRSRDRGIYDGFLCGSTVRFASMGPRSRDRGIAAAASVGELLSPGFNGAAIT